MSVRKPHTERVIAGADLVPSVPRSHFTSLDEGVIKSAWQIVGPSVALNLGSMKPVPLWAIFAACYAEGLHHGAELMREQLTAEALL